MDQSSRIPFPPFEQPTMTVLYARSADARLVSILSKCPSKRVMVTSPRVSKPQKDLESAQD